MILLEQKECHLFVSLQLLCLPVYGEEEEKDYVISTAVVRLCQFKFKFKFKFKYCQLVVAKMRYNEVR